jgi:hypothetical protein
MSVQYDLPDPVPASSQSCLPVSLDTPQAALPEITHSWLECGAQLLSPAPQQQLEADRPQDFNMCIPCAIAAALVPHINAQGQALQSARCTTLPKEALLLDSREHGFFSATVTIPRRPVLDVMVRRASGDQWHAIMRFAVLPESQHIRDRPDLWVSSPMPHAKDPRMALVCF